MKLTELIKQGTSAISRLYPEREAREMVLAYLCHTLGITRHTHLVEPSYEVAADRMDRIMGDISRMVSGEPLQYVVGQASFYGRDFHVTPSVLIPRPETELLCRLALDSVKAPSEVGDMSRDFPDAVAGEGRRAGEAGSPDGFRILDLCTGSGCIAWTMALEMPRVEVTAVDISDDALLVAAGQDFDDEMQRTGAVAPHFVKADVISDDLTAMLSCVDPANGGTSSSGRYDLILSNPPYVMDKEKALMRTNVLDHEPHLALFVPDDDPLRFYRAIARHAAALLSENGTGIVEINEALGPETASLFSAAGFTDVRVAADLNDRPRFVIARR